MIDEHSSLFEVFLMLISIAGLATHIILCCGAERWGFLIIGTIITPMGIVHGIGNFCGFW